MSKFHLYTPDGWLNMLGIAALPVWCIAIVGARQTGKTYGTMHHLLDNKHPFIYMRRTEDELELIESDDSLNPFLPMADFGYYCDVFRAGKIWQVRDYSFEDDKKKAGAWRGLAVPLKTIAKMRGFNGSEFTDLFYDEFIPEKGVAMRRSEGDSVSNAYTTINGNRELMGKPPLRLWMLANANDIKNPVLEAMELVKPFEKLMRSNKEWLIEDGVFIGYPRSEKIVEQRSQTAFMRRLSEKNRFKRMALNNEFAYDNLNMVKQRPLTGLVPYITVGKLHIYTTKQNTHYYVTQIPHKRYPKFTTSDKDMFVVQTEYVDVRLMYNAGYMTFDSVDSLLTFRELFGIKTD